MRNNYHYHAQCNHTAVCVITNKNYQNSVLDPAVKFLEVVVTLKLRVLRFHYGDG